MHSLVALLSAPSTWLNRHAAFLLTARPPPSATKNRNIIIITVFTVSPMLSFIWVSHIVVVVDVVDDIILQLIHPWSSVRFRREEACTCTGYYVFGFHPHPHTLIHTHCAAPPPPPSMFMSSRFQKLKREGWSKGKEEFKLWVDLRKI